jgi:intergrase/recombinase
MLEKNCQENIWIRGNKKAFVTILPTKMWEQLRRITKFDRHDIVAARSITKSGADILYMGVRKIHYNVMRFKDTMTADEALQIGVCVQT